MKFITQDEIFEHVSFLWEGAENETEIKSKLSKDIQDWKEYYLIENRLDEMYEGVSKFKDKRDIILVLAAIIIIEEWGHHCYKDGVFDNNRIEIKEIVMYIQNGQLRDKIKNHRLKFIKDRNYNLDKYLDWLLEMIRNNFNEYDMYVKKILSVLLCNKILGNKDKEFLITYVKKMWIFSRCVQKAIERKDLEMLDHYLKYGPKGGKWLFG